jgi:uncharacterized protein involved in exopolysaccharide biosynthesis
MAWTINVRHPDRQSAQYIAGILEKSGEEVLRRAAAQQYETQQTYVMRLVSEATDATRRQTLYDVLSTIDRSLFVLRSGSSVAVVVVSAPFAPLAPSYPPRLLSFAIAVIVLSILALAALTVVSWRSLRRAERLADADFAATEAVGYQEPTGSLQS